MQSDHPKAALRVEQSLYDVESKPTYVVDSVDNITELITHMRSDPNYFISRFVEENHYSHIEKENVFFTIKNINNETTQDKGKDIPVLAVSRYVYEYKAPSGCFANLLVLPLLFLPIAIIFGIVYVMTLSTQRAEDGSLFPPECILYLEDGKPIAVDVRRTLLYYDPAERHASLLNHIWEGTAMPDQLRMAYHPIEAGCEIIHIAKGEVIKQ